MQIYSNIQNSNNFAIMAKASTTNPKGAGRKPLETKNVRTSLFTNEDHLQAIKYISFKDDVTKTAIINSALAEYIQKWIKKNGPIPQK